jgi:outer membrane protein
MPQPRGCPTRGWRPRSLAAPGVAAAAALALLIAGSTAAAQTLTEALAYVYRNNPQLLAQRAALRATDEEVPQALSGWRPTVIVTGQTGFNRAGQTTNSALTGNPISQYGSFINRSVQLQATQPIYRGGRTEAATRQAINTVQAARAQMLTT